MPKNIFVKVIFGLVLAILIVAFVNIGFSLINPSPKYTDYCDEPRPVLPSEQVTKEEQQNLKECADQFEQAMSERNKTLFFIIAPIGFILLVIGTFMKDLVMQIMLMLSGFINTLSAIIQNDQDKVSIFITIALLLVIGILFVRKKLKD